MELIDANAKNIESAIRQLLIAIGENPDREGLKETPARIARMYREIFRGYDPEQKPKITVFENEDGYNGMVFDSGEFYSMCEHHMLPFFGEYYFAYIPRRDGKILGISKISRVVSYCAARLQLQERLCKDVVTMLSAALNNYCDGMAILMQGRHLCKSMRGARNSGKMSAVYFTGNFREDQLLRN